MIVTPRIVLASITAYFLGEAEKEDHFDTNIAYNTI